MTAVVSVVSAGGAFIGVDSRITATCRAFNDAPADIKTFRRGCLVGAVAGPTRLGQVLQHGFPEIVAVPDPDLLRWVVTGFASTLKQTLEDAGGVAVGNDSGQWTVVLGVNGRVFEVDYDLCVLEVTRYSAVGCGREFALGALTALDGLDLSGQDRARRALEAAAAHDIHVAPPFTILRVE